MVKRALKQTKTKPCLAGLVSMGRPIPQPLSLAMHCTQHQPSVTCPHSSFVASGTKSIRFPEDAKWQMLHSLDPHQLFNVSCSLINLLTQSCCETF